MKTNKKFCSVKDAAAVLGYSAVDLRGLLNTGRVYLGRKIEHDKRTEWQLEKKLVLKEAGLKEWPESLDTNTPAEAAEEAGKQFLEKGIDPAEAAEILWKNGIITKPMEKRMKGAAKV